METSRSAGALGWRSLIPIKPILLAMHGEPQSPLSMTKQRAGSNTPNRVELGSAEGAAVDRTKRIAADPEAMGGDGATVRGYLSWVL